MALFLCCYLKRCSFTLLRFPFLDYDQVFWCEISLVCRLKYPYSCFSSYFCYSFDHCVVLFLVVVISLPLFFFMRFLSRLIDVSTLSSMLTSLLPPPYPHPHPSYYYYYYYYSYYYYTPCEFSSPSPKGDFH